MNTEGKLDDDMEESRTESVAMKARWGFGLAFVGLLVALYGLLGGPTAESGLIGLGVIVIALGALLVARARP